MRCPTDPAHGELARRPPQSMTPEQAWCGEWWDCPKKGCASPCYSSVLIPPPDMEQAARSRSQGKE